MSIEVIDQDLTTKAGWEGYLAAECERTAKRGAEHELRIHECQLALTVDVHTGKQFAQPMIGVFATIFEGEDATIEAVKEEFAVLIRAISVCGKAIASVFVSEAWMSQAVSLDAPRIQPKNDPNRREALLISATHRSFGSCIFTAFISKGRKIEPWVRNDEGLSGRFGSLLASKRSEEDPKVIAASRLYMTMQKDRLQVLFRRDPDAAH